MTLPPRLILFVLRRRLVGGEDVGGAESISDFLFGTAGVLLTKATTCRRFKGSEVFVKKYLLRERYCATIISVSLRHLEIRFSKKIIIIMRGRKIIVYILIWFRYWEKKTSLRDPKFRHCDVFCYDGVSSSLHCEAVIISFSINFSFFFVFCSLLLLFSTSLHPIKLDWVQFNCCLSKCSFKLQTLCVRVCVCEWGGVGSHTDGRHTLLIILPPLDSNTSFCFPPVFVAFYLQLVGKRQFLFIYFFLWKQVKRKKKSKCFVGAAAPLGFLCCVSSLWGFFFSIFFFFFSPVRCVIVIVTESIWNMNRGDKTHTCGVTTFRDWRRLKPRGAT